MDILNATKRIAVEVNGNQHTSFNKFFHKTRINYLRSIQRDHKKLEWLKTNDFELIEIEEKEVPLVSYEFIRDKLGIEI